MLYLANKNVLCGYPQARGAPEGLGLKGLLEVTWSSPCSSKATDCWLPTATSRRLPKTPADEGFMVLLDGFNGFMALFLRLLTSVHNHEQPRCHSSSRSSLTLLGGSAPPALTVTTVTTVTPPHTPNRPPRL